MLAIISKIKSKIKSLKSLRTQSMVVLILVGMIPLVIFTLIFINTYRSKAISQRINELQSRGSVICNLVISSAYFTNDSSAEVDAELTQVADIFEGRILIADSNLSVLRDTYGLEEGKVILMEDVVRCLKGEETKIISHDKNNVELVLAVQNPESDSVDGAVIMDFSLNRVNDLYDSMQTIALTLFLVLGLIIIVVSVLYSGRIVMPMKEVAGSIAMISSGDFNETMNLVGYTEAENIADNFNSMLSVLQNLEDARQEFVSNVSHELKTPITSVKVLAESLIEQEDVPVELYQEFMVDINEELERMNKIINDLLSLVKMDKNASEVNISEVNINEFLESILKQLQPIADKRNIEIIFESVRPVTAQVDEVKLSMAFRNLIENAIKYNYDNGWVRVSLNADHKFFYLRVSDSGVGIPEDLQDNIFERFYRVDKARSRETGGNGLGLAITRNAILLHRGSIKVHSVEQQGTTFAVRIPLMYLE
ncbi:MAG: ATP-binding protein [Eubacterium sp.]|nr:ATP-binding protein [Eubacterium sp.]